MAVSIDGSGRISGVFRTQTTADAASKGYVDTRLGATEEEFAVEGGTKQELQLDGTTYLLHEFNVTGSLTVTGTAPVTLLVAGGGGGGASDEGGGGGSGGVVVETLELTAGEYFVTVGSGGPGGPFPGTSVSGQSGTDSRVVSLPSETPIATADGGQGGEPLAGGVSGGTSVGTAPLSGVNAPPGLAGAGAAAGQAGEGGGGVQVSSLFGVAGDTIGIGGPAPGSVLPEAAGGGAGTAAGLAGINGGSGLVAVLYPRSARTRATSLQHPLASGPNIVLNEDGSTIITDLRVPGPSVPTGGGLEGTSYVFVAGDGTAAENGTALAAAYTTAKGMTPYGNALADDNRVSVVVAPGIYDTTLTMDGAFVNVVSLDGGMSIRLTGIDITANNVLVRGIDVGTTNFLIGDDLAGLVAENCKGGDDSFRGNGGSASGTFTNCTGGDNAFGGFGFASGTFTNCTAGNNAFGSSVELSGLVLRCRVTSGGFPTPSSGGKVRLSLDSNFDEVNIG